MKHLGDTGKTLIPSLGRVSKSHLLVKCLASLDMSQAFVGDAKLKVDHTFIETLDKIQQLLYTIMADIATSSNSSIILESEIQFFEAVATGLEKKSPPLNRFVIPGSNPAETACNIARTTVRAAEVSFVELYESDPQKFNSGIITALNRFSWILYLIQIASTTDIEYATRPRDLKITNTIKE